MVKNIISFLILILISPVMWAGPFDRHQATWHDENARTVHARVWTPTSQHAHYILAAHSNQAPLTTITRYLNSASDIAGIQSEIPFLDWFAFAGENPTLFDLKPKAPSQKPRSLFVATRFLDHMPLEQTDRLESVLKRFAHEGSENFVIPLAAIEHLNEREAMLFWRDVDTKFSNIVFLGGPDVSPVVYGEEARPNGKGAVNFNATIDRIQIKMMQQAFEYTDLKIIAICLGSQLLQVALADGKIHQHIPDDLQTVLEHQGNTIHDSILVPSPKNPIYRYLGIKDKNLPAIIRVRSDHHQATVKTPQFLRKFIIFAQSADPQPVIEAYGDAAGRVLAFQGHIERPDPLGHGDAIIRGIMNDAKEKLNSIETTPKLCLRRMQRQ